MKFKVCFWGVSLFFYQAAVSVKISNLFICFCSFDFLCAILEKDSFIENLYIGLSY